MIFVVGPHGAGKTYLARFLHKEGFEFVDTGPALRQVWAESSTDLDFPSFIRLGEEKQGHNFTDQILAKIISDKIEHLVRSGCNQDLLIVGNRSKEGIDYLRRQVDVVDGRRTVIIFIGAEDDLLHTRFCKREGVNLPFSAFKAQILQKDISMGLDDLRQLSDYFISNNGTLTEFEDSISRLMFGELAIERSRGSFVEGAK